MKTLFGGLIAFMLVGISACDKNHDDNPSNPGNIKQVISGGEWIITLFSEDGDNETNHFNGFVFTFSENGQITAVKDQQVQSGTWSSGSDNSNAKLILNFNSAHPFDELSEDWNILESGSLVIRLRHVSGGDGGTDLLTFSRK